MLQAAQQIDDDLLTAPAPAVAEPSAVKPVPHAAYTPGDRYGEKKLNLRAVAITVAVHAALLGGLLTVQYSGAKKERAPLLTIAITADQPPAPPAKVKEPEPNRPAIVAPVPLIDVPRSAPPQIATSPDPVPVPVEAPPAAQEPAPPAPPAPPAMIKIENLGARLVSGKPPRYPIESRRHNEQGTVSVSFVIGVDGRVKSVSLKQSSGFRRLDEAALTAARTWRFDPIIRDGIRYEASGFYEFPFSLT